MIPTEQSATQLWAQTVARVEAEAKRAITRRAIANRSLMNRAQRRAHDRAQREQEQDA